MYTVINFKTKKDLKQAIADGRKIAVFQPNNLFGRPEPTDGKVTLEGPHYPAPHTWYATGVLKDGYLVHVK